MGGSDEELWVRVPGAEPFRHVAGPAAAPSSLSGGGVPAEDGEGVLLLGVAEQASLLSLLLAMQMS